MELGEPSNSDCDNNFIASFPYNTVTVKVDEENLPPLLYSTGYIIISLFTQNNTDIAKNIHYLVHKFITKLLMSS